MKKPIKESVIYYDTLYLNRYDNASGAFIKLLKKGNKYKPLEVDSDIRRELNMTKKEGRFQELKKSNFPYSKSKKIYRYITFQGKKFYLQERVSKKTVTKLTNIS